MNTDVIIINIQESDLNQVYPNKISFHKEYYDSNDTIYWDKDLWFKLLKNIMSQNPKGVAVAMYLGDNLNSISTTVDQDKIFQHPKIYWATFTSERSFRPQFAKIDKSNIGSLDFVRDEDGIIRRFASTNAEVSSLPEKLAEKNLPFYKDQTHLINYRGERGLFKTLSLKEALENHQLFENKYVIIGSNGNTSAYLTPIGPMSRAEITAQITDNLLENRWIKRIPSFISVCYLFLIMILSVWVMINYPQSIAFGVLFWIGILGAAISAWIFDSAYIWVPAMSTLVQLMATWIIFIGYQAMSIERKNWELKQEQLYLQELEQLKNNFVSLISHDLKTPIAKIQAVVDRMLVQTTHAETARDLQSIRLFSDELNKYIQSILKLLRVESRDFRLHKEISDINEIIEQALEQLTPLARERQITIQTQLEPMFSIEVDVTLIKEVIINLVENAIKYSQNGGRIMITSKEIDTRVDVEVSDTGEGISPEELNNVWGKFVRGKGQDHKTKGTGLGLYLVRYFIELHGGNVHMKSVLGKGTTVGFSLPVESESELIDNNEFQSTDDEHQEGLT